MGRGGGFVCWLAHSRSANFSVIVCGGKSIYLGARGGRESWRVAGGRAGGRAGAEEVPIGQYI